MWFLMAADLQGSSSDVIITLTGSKLLKCGIKINVAEPKDYFSNEIQGRNIHVSVITVTLYE